MGIVNLSEWYAWYPVRAWDRERGCFRWTWLRWVRRYHHSTRGYTYTA